MAMAIRLACSGEDYAAVPLLERVLADRAQALGEDHPETMICRNALAPAYRAAGRRAMAHQHAGRPSEAIPLFEQALAGLERVFGSAHPETVRARENLMQAQGGDAKVRSVRDDYEFGWSSVIVAARR